MQQPPAARSARTEAPTGFWQHTVGWWHAVLATLLGLVAVVLVAATGPTAGQRWLGVAMLAVIAAAYVLFGRRALGAPDALGLALAYLVPAWAAFLVLLTITPAAYLLLFALFSQYWAMLPTRTTAILWSVVSIGSIVVVRILTGDDSRDALVFGAVNLSLTLLFGLWISGVIEESSQRAELIDELERTRAELAGTERSHGALQERERLAGEIHDTIAQGLTSILALAQAVDAALERGTPDDLARARERLELLEAAARDGLAEARSLVAAMGPVDLESATLVQAVERLAARFRAETGIGVRVVVEGDAAVRRSANAEVVLVRAAQEALANVRRHAAAQHVDLRLVLDGARAELTVSDDGRGFAGKGPSSGFGLDGMRARARQVGGDVRVSSAPGAGTTVSVSVPS